MLEVLQLTLNSFQTLFNYTLFGSTQGKLNSKILAGMLNIAFWFYLTDMFFNNFYANML